MTRRRRRILITIAAVSLAIAISIWLNRHPIDPRLVGHWTWSDRPDSHYPVINFRDDGTADAIPWGRGMFRTFLSGVNWWHEGDQLVVQYPGRPIEDFHTFKLWLQEKFAGGPYKHRFDLLEVTPNQIRWRS